MSAPLREREFRLLFSGQCVSNLGDWLDFIALAVLIAYVWEMGPASLAALSIAIAIPWIFVAPFAGVLVDRWPKKQVLIGSDLAAGGRRRGADLRAEPAGPARARLLQDDRRDVLPARRAGDDPDDRPGGAAAPGERPVAARAAVDEGHRAGARRPHRGRGEPARRVRRRRRDVPRLGGDPRADAADRRPAARAARDEEDEEEGGYWAELREGLQYIVSRRALVICIVSFAATIFLLFSFDTLAPLAFQELGVSKALFGLAVAAIGLGGVRRDDPRRPLRRRRQPVRAHGRAALRSSAAWSRSSARAAHDARRAAVDLDAGALRRRHRLRRDPRRRADDHPARDAARAHGPGQHVGELDPDRVADVRADRGRGARGVAERRLRLRARRLRRWRRSGSSCSRCARRWASASSSRRSPRWRRAAHAPQLRPAAQALPAPADLAGSSKGNGRATDVRPDAINKEAQHVRRGHAAGRRSSRSPTSRSTPSASSATTRSTRWSRSGASSTATTRSPGHARAAAGDGNFVW